MVIKPKVRGFLCTTTHPTGCLENVRRQMSHVQAKGPIPEGPRGTRPPGLTVVAAVAGYPLISVPMGRVDGLPVGLTFASTAWTEARLLSMAYDYEQASMARVPPERAVGTR